MFVCLPQHAASNILRSLAGKAPKPYSPHAPFMVLVLGRWDGIILPPFGFSCIALLGLIAALSKSAHLLIPRFWWQLNAKRPVRVAAAVPSEASQLLKQD